MTKNYDVVIIGGGLVGLATACALRDSNLKIAVVDTKFASSIQVDDIENIGIRASAINLASQHYFKQIGIWDKLIASHRLQFFNSIQVWEKDGHARLNASSQDYGYLNFGHIIENNIMLHYLYQHALSSQNITLVQSECISYRVDDNYATIKLVNELAIQAKLIIGADGAVSWVRKQANISLIERDYRHHAVITTVKTEHPHDNCAKQLFYAQGIVAFLPLFEPNKSCLVWSCYPEQARALQAMPKDEFSNALFALTGDEVGQSKLINQRMTFPLRARLAQQFIKHRIVLIGDAAHTIHPLAGQGVNLGFQDSANLIHTIRGLTASGKDIGICEHLKSFQFNRRKDVLIMMTAMQTIQDMFDGNHSIKKALRTLGMNAIDKVSPLKKQLIKYAMNLR